MIICSCDELSHQDVRSIVAAVHAFGQIRSWQGCSVECGHCAPTIRRIRAGGLPARRPDRALKRGVIA